MRAFSLMRPKRSLCCFGVDCNDEPSRECYAGSIGSDHQPMYSPKSEYNLGACGDACPPRSLSSSRAPSEVGLPQAHTPRLISPLQSVLASAVGARKQGEVQHNDIRRHSADMTCEYEATDEVLERLRRELDDAKRRIHSDGDENQRVIDEASAELEHLRKLLDFQRVRTRSAQAKLVQQEEDLDAVQQQLRCEQDSFQRAQTQHARELQHVERTMQSLESQLEEHRASLSEIQQQLREKDQENKSLHGQVESLREQKEEAHSKLAEIRRRFKNKLDEFALRAPTRAPSNTSVSSSLSREGQRPSLHEGVLERLRASRQGRSISLPEEKLVPKDVREDEAAALPSYAWSACA